MPAAYAQEKTVLKGTVTDENGQPLFLVNVSAKGTSFGSVTGDDGKYNIELPSDTVFTIIYSRIGFQPYSFSFDARKNDFITKNISLKESREELKEVSVTENAEKGTTLDRIEMKSFDMLPNTSGGLESILKTLPGVSSTNELSSQYSVRGGNFDENLVYVNNIEVYRPFLIRSGQQEGLSFINSDMVSAVRFSAGGFEARFGDKMSSVLDITYRKPTHTRGSVTASLLGGAVHFEGASANQRFTHISGFRYRTSRYLLSSLDTKGEYNPEFYDFQTYLTYNVTDKFELGLLANVSQNNYAFIPEDRETQFGTVSTALSFKVFYEGQEYDKFQTFTGALTGTYRPNENLKLSLIASNYQTIEQESFDIQGYYLINALDNDPDSDNFGDSLMNIGIGSYLDHARNELDARVLSLAHKGEYSRGGNKLFWGIRARSEYIEDELNEWNLVDSAGYSIPFSPSNVFLYETTRATNTLASVKLTSYLQNTYTFEKDSHTYYLTGGLRGSYWDVNGEFNLSPRISMAVEPNWEKDILLQFASGYYIQYPFYREMRNPQGELNKETIEAQKSVHFVLSGDYTFMAWDRPFKFTTEVYYKILRDVIPYRVNDVRLEYMAENRAKGYATGIDFKLFGEFVPGNESWVSLSFLRTREEIEGDRYRNDEGGFEEAGYYRRPTDQLMNFGLFFQDYLPSNPSYKVHLNFLYGTNLPTSPPNQERYDLIYEIRPYRRVDLGFSKMINTGEGILANSKPFQRFESIWISAEIFNLLGVNNVISYQWVKTVSNLDNIQGQYAIPNFLTGRRFNVKLQVKF